MKKITILSALIIILTSACQKDEIQPSIEVLKEKVIECKKCEEGWDLTEAKP